MSELPKLDPVKLYNKALTQITDLNSQNIQMDTMIEVLKEERDAAIKERDAVRLELSNMVTLMENEKLQKLDEDNQDLKT